MSTSDRFDPIVGNSSLIQGLWSFVLEVSDSRLPVVLHGEDGVGKKLAARKIHATGGIAGSRIRFLDGASLKADQLFGDDEAHSILNRSGTVYIGEAEKIPASVVMEMLKLHDEEAHRLPRLIFGFRNEPENPIMKMIELMKPAGEFHLSPLSDRPEDISPIARFQIWSQCLKEDFQKRWADFETYVLPEFLTRDWSGNVEELLEAVKEFCQVSAEEDGSRLVGEINRSVSSHWLKEQFERMHEKLLDRWNHEDSMSAGDLPGETWRAR
ncbi:hypothetical protein CBD41_09680 [bacterium TMED181]|nr:hypothetical protein [Planctomycetota bacterium]OUW42149.1 MAG: hypothetical protein CBD41_09680 [bacterium TMED181]